MAVINDRHMLDRMEDGLFPEEDVGAKPEPHVLLDGRGRLLKKGCCDMPPAELERGSIPALRRWTRFRETDSCFAAGDGLRLHVAAGDTGLGGFISITLHDTRTGETRSRTKLYPFSFGSMEMPQSPVYGDLMVRRGDVSLDMARSPAARYIRCRFEDFDDIRSLYINLELKAPEYAAPHASDGTVYGLYITRETDSRAGFEYAAHYPCLKASGTVVLGADRYELGGGDCASYEWWRSVQPAKTTRCTLSASGGIGGELIGISIAEGGAAVLSGGRISILQNVDIPFRRENPTEPFDICSPDGEMRLRFEPERLEYERIASPSLLGCERQLVFGSVGGCVSDDAGETSFDGIPAQICSYRAKW